MVGSISYWWNSICIDDLSFYCRFQYVNITIPRIKGLEHKNSMP